MIKSLISNIIYNNIKPIINVSISGSKTILLNASEFNIPQTEESTVDIQLSTAEYPEVVAQDKPQILESGNVNIQLSTADYRKIVLVSDNFNSLESSSVNIQLSTVGYPEVVAQSKPQITESSSVNIQLTSAEYVTV